MATKKNVFEIVADKRTVVGKKVSSLRKQGLIPANIYGEDFKSAAISIKLVEFVKLYRAAGETNVINIKLDKDAIPVLIHQIQYHPVNDKILHIDFRKVNLLKAIETEVPVKIIGESSAIKSNQGVLLTLADSIKIEALPDKIPDNFEVDISALEVGSELKISDLATDKDYKIIDNPEKVILRITDNKEESIEPEVTAPVTEVPGEVPAEEAAETTAEAPAKAEEKTEKSSETKPAPETKK